MSIYIYKDYVVKETAFIFLTKTCFVFNTKGTLIAMFTNIKLKPKQK